MGDRERGQQHGAVGRDPRGVRRARRARGGGHPQGAARRRHPRLGDLQPDDGHRDRGRPAGAEQAGRGARGLPALLRPPAHLAHQGLPGDLDPGRAPEARGHRQVEVQRGDDPGHPRAGQGRRDRSPPDALLRAVGRRAAARGLPPLADPGRHADRGVGGRPVRRRRHHARGPALGGGHQDRLPAARLRRGPRALAPAGRRPQRHRWRGEALRPPRAGRHAPPRRQRLRAARQGDDRGDAAAARLEGPDGLRLPAG